MKKINDMQVKYDFTEDRANLIFLMEGSHQIDHVAQKMLQYNTEQLSNILPVEIVEDENEIRAVVNIWDYVNYRAWSNEASEEERELMEQKCQEVMSLLKEYMIPKEEVLFEERYMYVQEATKELKLICIPVLPKEELLDEESEEIVPVDLMRKGVAEEPAKEPEKEPEKEPVKEPEKEPEKEPVKEPEKKPEEEPKASAPESISEELTKQTVKESLKDIFNKKAPKVKCAYLIRLGTNEKFELEKDTNIIGKHSEVVDICIRGNNTISRKHCMIHHIAESYYLEDCGSANYTFLNGGRVYEGEIMELLDEDIIMMANEEFQFFE